MEKRRAHDMETVAMQDSSRNFRIMVLVSLVWLWYKVREQTLR